MAKFKGAVLTCGECGSAFKVPPSRASKAQYCSNECAYKHRMDGRRKRATLICAGCGSEFESVACQAHRRKYCSDTCRHGDPSYSFAKSKRFRGENNPQWNGGRSMHSDGYVYRYAPYHPFATRERYVLEHRLVMEEWLRENEPDSPYLIKLGDQVYLSPAFVVHHKDEDRANNAPDNLVCMTPEEHKRHHSAG